MARLTQNYYIEKDVKETFNFKLSFRKITNNMIFTLYIINRCDIIKEIKPDLVQDNNVYFTIPNDIKEGDYYYDIYMQEGDNIQTVLSDRRLLIEC